ncbi:MICOS complex subunit MIC60-like isoform X1 [Zingiber officinale]|uniref:MICOS complex subunit MIC60-like isoform X1 n=1 Tax=Zingiber officinale TaxID=94328 RepID=UPI001C4D863E|nr:MICOS complex subunit MIC60-like isoform X1 [Zingiber officinale]
MLRRCFCEISSHQAICRIRPILSQQTSFYLSSRKQFSGAAKENSSQKPAPAENDSNSTSSISKLVFGSMAVGAVAMAAYKADLLGIQVMEERASHDATILNEAKTPKDLEQSVDQAIAPINSEPTMLEPEVDIVDKSDVPQSQEIEIKTEAIDVSVPGEEILHLKENEPEEVDSKEPSEKIVSVTNEQVSVTEKSPEDAKLDDILAQTEVSVEQTKVNGTSEETVGLENVQVSEEAGLMEVPPKMVELDYADAEKETPKPLSESYLLQDEQSIDISSEKVNNDAAGRSSTSKEDKRTSEDEKKIFDLIEVIHAAEKKQAESDASIFAEEKRILKEKYEKELKDARARELMYAEEAAILDKELSKVKAKAAAAIKSIEEKAENNLRGELQRKDEEFDMQLKKVTELAKAELAAAIAKEKSSQIEKIAEANLNINALCLAFYARSEEARQTHSIHKLALGTLALEDALSRGLPIQSEVVALLKSLEGIDKDSLLQVALSSLPEEILDNGANTQMQLNEKFESLKGILRHFSLIPAGGGGILAHLVADIASSLKMKEQSGDGIESIISRVENLLVDGNFTEAADVLEEGVHGSEAKEVVAEWARHARNRAVAEQALSLLHSYALSVTFS